MTDNFYHAFEEKYRGSRELIKSRQNAYAPYVELLKVQESELRALDLGCGRGEWLELLEEWGVKAEGVDLDAAMLEACYQMGLSVQKDNALTVLENIPAASLDIVSGFHIAEHLDFPDLVALVKNAFKALKPGGLLILETPNSENINVATSSFYLDPTHRNPIPAQLLKFLFQYAGFDVVREVRLNADFQDKVDKWISLHDVVGGVSRDYGVIGQTPLTSESNPKLSIGYVQDEVGVSYLDLVGRYDSQAHRVNEKIQDLNLKFRDLELKLSNFQALEFELMNLKAKVHRLETPFRLMKRAIQKILGLSRALLAIPYWLLKKLKSFVKKILIVLIKKLGLYSKIYAFYHRHRDRVDYESLNAHAKDVYTDLKKEISDKRGSK